MQTDRNERDIANLATFVRAVEAGVARLEGGMQGLTLAVQALTASIKNGNGHKNGSA